MIRDLSQTLEALLKDPTINRGFPELKAADVAFDRPSEKFSPSRTAIDLFLYDIRENLELRTNEPQISRYEGMVTLTPPPLRVACSYLVTAWPTSGPDLFLQEHRLLSQALELLAGCPTIPARCLRGRLKDQEPPLPMITARTDGLKDPAEFWSALGSPLRASIVVTATIAMEPAAEAVTVHRVESRDLTVNPTAERLTPTTP